MRDLEFEISNHIGIIRLNRPESLNAFSHEMIKSWIDALEEIRDNDDIYVGIVTGNGSAFCAGLDMALMCDIRYCSDQARLGEGYVKAGIVPGDGGGYYLPRIVGVDKALEMLWTGKILTASEAKEIGLVSHVVPHNQLWENVLDFANQLTLAPQEVIRMTKRIVYQSLTLNLKQSLDMVSSLMAIAVHHPDYTEAVMAMMEKRKPKFQGMIQDKIHP